MRQYMAAIKIQRAYRRWATGGSTQRRRLGGDPDMRLFDDVMSWKKLSSAAANARQTAMSEARTTPPGSLMGSMKMLLSKRGTSSGLRASGGQGSGSESGTPNMSRQGSSAGVSRSSARDASGGGVAAAASPERPSSPSPSAPPSPMVPLGHSSKRRAALAAAEAAAVEAQRTADVELNDNNNTT